MVKVLTIGYGGKRPTKFLTELENMNPDLVIDVRRDATKAFLGFYTYKHLEKVISHYVWLPDLGNARKALPPVLINEEAGLEKALLNILMLKKCDTVVLLCAEKDENRCHRKYVKEKLQKLL